MCMGLGRKEGEQGGGRGGGGRGGCNPVQAYLSDGVRGGGSRAPVLR